MKDDQLIRSVAAIALSAGLGLRLGFVGNGPISFFGFETTPFGLFVVAVVVLALPETIDMLPFGPERSETGDEHGHDEEQGGGEHGEQ